MKVIFGVHHYPPHYSAGVELVVQRHSRWLAARGHDVEVVCIERIDGPCPITATTERLDGVTVHRLELGLAGTIEHLGLRYRDTAVRDWFSSFFANAQADVFHSHSSYLLGAGPIETAVEHGIPSVATLHDYWYVCPRITLLRSDGQRCNGAVTPSDCASCLQGEQRRYRMVDTALAGVRDRWPLLRAHGVPVRTPNKTLVDQVTRRREYLEGTLRGLDRIIVLAPFAKQLLADRGFVAPQVQMIPSGHDSFGWKKKQQSFSKNGLRVGYLGQIAPHKGVHLLIEAFRNGVPYARGGELRIHGDGTPFPRYMNQLRALTGDDPRISFHGSYPNGQVQQVLRDIDVLAVPSVWYETRPLVIMEAFAAGVPVIASDLPNLQYQVRDGVDGLLFAPGDSGALASTLQKLTSEPGLLAELVAGILPNRTLAEEMREIEQIYQNLSTRRGANATSTRPAGMVALA